jgi:hypothetical protein
MTLSAADAAAHFVQNPFTPESLKSQVGITLAILTILGVIFLKGFQEAINVAVWLVGVYLALNAVVTCAAFWEVVRHPHVFVNWKDAMVLQHGDPLVMLGISLILFPKLALGLSGFETGVAVMPLIKGKDQTERTQNTKKLLFTAALIMSVFLIATSVVTTLLIEPDKFREGGEANGRALAYLGHKYLGNGFGSVYDISTILILGFAGASAMAGLLNLIPRYLPRFGMAPEWMGASRPLVLVFVAVSFTVTLLFHANVDAQGGAYATGVLVLITSAALAVTAYSWGSRMRMPFSLIALVFVYTTVLNIYERPEGIKIATFFIATMVTTSLISRAMRSTELRIKSVTLDDKANELLANHDGGTIRLIARRPRLDSEEELDRVDSHVRRSHNLPEGEPVFFAEVERGDASEFTDHLVVTGEMVGNHAVFRARSPVVANALAALLMHLEKVTGQIPHAYFQWTEGSPVWNVFRFVFLGEGDTAPVTHEVLRRAIADPKRRPVIHVS